VEQVEALLGREPGGVSAAAIRFALTPPEVSVVLSGAASPEEIESVVRAADQELPAEVAAAVKRLGGGKVRAL
jgi:aryl-alcohol dehydrogenase-like predicted oxidoreductase